MGDLEMHRVETREDPTDTPLTAKRVFYGSPPDVEMQLTVQQQLGLAWLLNHVVSMYDNYEVRLRHRGGAWLEIDPVQHGVFARKKSYAIWHNTGAVYEVSSDGAVEADPIYDPSERSY